MDTENTSIHLRQWTKSFWLIALANLLFTTALSMQAICLPESARKIGFSYMETGLLVVAYAVGLYLLGPFCNYLTQAYRRNKVCMLTMLCFTLTLYAVSYYSTQTLFHNHGQLYGAALVLVLLMGMTFGLSQMLFTSTLVIDKCESYQRTDANHHVAWMGRLALSVGPFAALMLGPTEHTTLIVSASCAAVALVLLSVVNFPFKTPEDDLHLFSLDRFFLPRGFKLFLSLIPVTMIMGLLLSTVRETSFYAFMMGGFLLAMVAERFAFADADLKSEAVTGLISILIALLLLMWRREMMVVHVMAPVMVGFGIGIIGSRFLLFFVNLSEHCRRGTAHSTFMLAWETGIALGLALGIVAFHGQLNGILLCAMGLTVLSLVVYVGYIHGWYLRHKAR